MLSIVQPGEHAATAQDLGELASSTDRFYEQHAAEYFERTVTADMAQLYERFLAMVPKAGRILDAGCGSGRDLCVFSRRGFRAMGIDASRALVAMAKSHSGAPCAVVRLEEIAYEKCFDGVWACASLLHLPKAMLAPVLQRLRRALVPGGVMFVSVQEGEGERLAPDGRFFAYYRNTEFVSAVKDAGFVFIDAWGSDDVLPERTAHRWINVLAKANDGLAGVR